MRFLALVLLVLPTLTGCFGAVEDEGCGIVACGPRVEQPQRVPAPAPTPAYTPAVEEQAVPQAPVLRTLPEGTCPAPYMGRSFEGNCVWSCSEGTQPDDTIWECVCRPGLTEVGTEPEPSGRRICR